jgi:misacylated tRNA(Ala) deacylase
MAFNVTVVVDVLPVFHFVVSVPVGGCGDDLPATNMSQLVSAWNLLVELKVPLVTPPPLQPPDFAPFTVTAGSTFCFEWKTGSGGLKVAVPLLLEQVVPPAAAARLAVPPTVITIGTTNAIVSHHFVDARIRVPSAGEETFAWYPRDAPGNEARARPLGSHAMATELLFLRDAYLREFDARVVSRRDDAVALDRTACYATGGGQPHDRGLLDDVEIVDVRKDGDLVWHTLAGAAPEEGANVHGVLDWDRRHRLMRTHSALHTLCGVIWNEWGKAVTGGNMEPLEARMDFEFDPLPEGFAATVTELVNAEIAADRPIEVSFLPRGTALDDADLIRTKVNLIPESVTEIRVVDIVGLDKQADGGTHVHSTAEIGRFEVVKTESKGKGNKRLRVRIHDA